MAGVAAQAVGVEIVVAAGLGERLFFLKNTSSGGLSSVNVVTQICFSRFRTHQPSEETTHLKAIEADDTVAMRNITFCQDFFCFLRERKETLGLL